MTLKDIYAGALAQCAPELLVREHVRPSMPRNVVAIGKCAGAMLDGVAAVHDVAHAFVAIPDGYKLPATRAEVHRGGHPQMTKESFEAGRALLAFVDAVVDAHGDILFLVSGGGSTCVEVPLAPHTEEELMEINARLVASGLPIAGINAERKKRSAIKGGRLGARVRGECVTLVYSDVATGRLADVASGPSERNLILVADNTTLVRAAASLVARPVIVEEQIEWETGETAGWEPALRASNSFQIAAQVGEPIMIAATGNNLRDLFLVARD
jgi:glycerate-2-kinase